MAAFGGRVIGRADALDFFTLFTELHGGYLSICLVDVLLSVAMIELYPLRG
jgi:hypothetical protein